MIKNFFYKFSILLFCFIISDNFVYGQTLQYENQKIKQLNIKVHTRSGVIEDKTSVSCRIKTQQGGCFSQSDFDEDLKTLALDYDRVNPIVTIDEGCLSITIEAWPKPVIRSICWEGNKKIATRYLEKELNIKCFSVFERQEFNIAFHKLKTYYIGQGYFEAELNYEVIADPESNDVCIVIKINEGRSGKIQKINFVNFTSCEENEILNQMITSKYNIFISWYDQSGTYNEDAMQQDRLMIINYLQNRGYADAEVTVNVEESCKTNRIIITITANKGRLYRFGTLSFEGNTVVDSCTINRIFTIRPGDPFSIENLNETVEAITDEYGRLGYIDATVDFEPELCEGQDIYNVRFSIKEGRQFRVGMIHVFGNTVTKPNVILNETLLVTGDLFNNLKLKADQERLSNIGFFKSVNAYIVKGTESSILGEDYRDVYIEVEETGTGQFSAFLGYSSVEEIFAGITIKERNFNHEGFYYFCRDGLTAFRGGGEYAELAFQIGQKSREYSFSWTKPYFLDSDWTIGCDISSTSTRYISKQYDLETLTLALRASYDINQFVRFGLQYRLTNGQVKLHHHAKRNKELERDSHINGLISAFGPSLSYDSTDHPVKPTEGFRSRLFIEYAGLGGTHHFLNTAYQNTYYMSVGSRLVFKYRGDLRFIQPLGSTSFKSIPVDERIFLGGEYMIRGFRPYRLGPHYKKEKDTPEGGLSLQFVSVEACRRITKDIEVFAFLDAGHLSKKTWEFGKMRSAIGYGARLKLIPSIPEVTIGMGYPLNAKRRGDVKKFFFSFGGSF